jgi:hypothetical protein
VVESLFIIVLCPRAIDLFPCHNITKPARKPVISYAIPVATFSGAASKDSRWIPGDAVIIHDEQVVRSLLVTPDLGDMFEVHLNPRQA